MTTAQLDFIYALRRFTNEVQEMPAFKGKTQVLRALKRIGELSALQVS